MELIVRVTGLCIALAAVEMLHGILRVRFVVPRLGRALAQRVSIVTGSFLALSVCWVLVPTLGVTARLPLLVLGFVLAAFMAFFDIAVARWLMRRPWSSIPEDFDPRRGNYIVFGLVVLVAAPNLIMAWMGR